VWLLLDGVDEMVANSGNPLSFIDSWIPGWCQQLSVVLTCRLNVWEANPHALNNFQTYRTLEFSQEKVIEFIEACFQESNPALGIQLQQALNQPGKERIKDLIRNPLRLTLLCSTWHLREGKLPDTKAELYQQYVEEVYRWKEDEFPTTPEQRKQLNAKLKELALAAIDKEENRFCLRHKFVEGVLGERDGCVFQLALNIGWLNRVGVDAKNPNPNQPVYAFFHPTFQEYFAALAIADWDFFLPRAHDNHNPQPVSERYRIFEPQWKEVILLWLGREEVVKEKTEEFIRALVEFQDRCGRFFRYRAYFLAAVSIAELRDCKYADAIVGYVVKLGFGYFHLKKQKWQRFPSWIEHKAREVLQESDRSLTINKLIELMRSVYAIPNQESYRQAIGFLGQIATGNSLAINTLVELLQTSNHEDIRQHAAKSLGLIDPGNPTAISTLIDLLHSSQESTTFTATINSLGKIGVGNLDAINTLKNLLASIVDLLWFDDSSDKIPMYLRKNSLDIEIFINTIKSLKNVIIDISEVINLLVELLEMCRWDCTCLIAAEELLKIAPNNQYAINILTNLLSTSRNPEKRLEAVLCLGKTHLDTSDSIDILTEILNSTKDLDTYLQAAATLSEVDPSNLTLAQMLVPDEDDEIRVQAAEYLLKINPRNQDAIVVLIDLLNASDLSARWKAADILGAMGISNSDVIINTLINLLLNDQEQNQGNGHHISAAQSLNKFIQKQLFSLVVTRLKNYLPNQLHTSRYEYAETIRYCCYEVIWHCAQNMTYPAFYKAWHQQEEVEKTNNPDRQSLNQADLPQSLQSAIANDPQLSQIIHLICIDRSQFIEPDRPAAEIYDQMLDQNCPECDRVPETMHALKLYWNSLKRKTDKRVVLVFYASSTNSTPDEGTTMSCPYSSAFLTVLSKFGREICAIAEQRFEHIPLKFFAPSQSIEDIVQWIRAIVLLYGKINLPKSLPPWTDVPPQ
jgi:HEAT repeat protein